MISPRKRLEYKSPVKHKHNWQRFKRPVRKDNPLDNADPITAWFLVWKCEGCQEEKVYDMVTDINK